MASDCRGLDSSTIRLILSDAREFLATLEAAGLAAAAIRMVDVVDALALARDEAEEPGESLFFGGD